MANVVIDTYSELADKYDNLGNLLSCWGRAAEDAARHIQPRPTDRLIVDVGCGVGNHLVKLARQAPDAQFVGIEPAVGMRARAMITTRNCPNVRIADGSFEHLPFEDRSVDYLFSIFAFHWVTDVARSIRQIARVLKPDGAMNLTFIGRNNGREFIKATSPIFLRYLGAKGLLESAALRKQLTLGQVREAFGAELDPERLEVSEEFITYHDTLEGHWSWWVRIESQFVQIPSDLKGECDRQVKAALAKLASDRGIPYTLHELHVRYA